MIGLNNMSQQALHINLDQSALGGSSCMLRLKNVVIEGYREPKLSRDITYGIAVHAFADSLFQTNGDLAFAVNSANKAFAIPSYEKPDKKHMSEPAHMIDTCLVLQREFIQKDKDFQLIQLMKDCPYCEGTGKVEHKEPISETSLQVHSLTCSKCNGQKQRIGAATEINFSIPYYADQYITVNLTGTIDKIGKFKNGIFAIGDWKTTSARSDDEYKVQDYFSSYEISIQLKFYTLALKLMARLHPASILGQIGATDMGAFIDAIFVRTKSMENKYRRSSVFRYTDGQLAEFQGLLDKKIQEISKAVQLQQFDRDGLINNTCQQKFGKCAFWKICKQTDPVIADLLYKRDFIKRVYNPLAFNK